MKMIDLEISAKEAKKMQEPCTAPKSDGGPRYPYGTRLEFDTDTIEKMPALKSLDVGDYVVVKAVACVTNKSQNEEQKSKKRVSLTIQLEQIGIAKRDDGKAAFDEEAEAYKK